MAKIKIFKLILSAENQKPCFLPHFLIMDIING